MTPIQVLPFSPQFYIHVTVISQFIAYTKLKMVFSVDTYVDG